MRRRWLTLALKALAASAHGQQASPTKVTLDIRGHAVDVYTYAASTKPARGRIIFAPGDGGWRGFAITIAETVSSRGYAARHIRWPHSLQKQGNAGIRRHAFFHRLWIELKQQLTFGGRRFLLAGISHPASQRNSAPTWCKSVPHRGSAPCSFGSTPI